MMPIPRLKTESEHKDLRPSQPGLQVQLPTAVCVVCEPNWQLHALARDARARDTWATRVTQLSLSHERRPHVRPSTGRHARSKHPLSQRISQRVMNIVSGTAHVTCVATACLPLAHQPRVLAPLRSLMVSFTHASRPTACAPNLRLGGAWSHVAWLTVWGWSCSIARLAVAAGRPCRASLATPTCRTRSLMSDGREPW